MNSELPVSALFVANIPVERWGVGLRPYLSRGRLHPHKTRDARSTQRGVAEMQLRSRREKATEGLSPTLHDNFYFSADEDDDPPPKKRGRGRKSRHSKSLKPERPIKPVMGVSGKPVKYEGVKHTLLRSSQIVPEPEFGNASDAGVLPDHRVAHLNRRRATILRIETLDAEGNYSRCPDVKKFLSHDSGYTRTLSVPKADRVLKPCRAPENLMSRNIPLHRKKPGDVSGPPRIGQGVKEEIEIAGEKYRRPEDSDSSFYDFGASSEDDNERREKSLLFWGDSERAEISTLGMASGHRLVKRRKPLATDPIYPIYQPQEDLLTAMFAQKKTPKDGGSAKKSRDGKGATASAGVRGKKRDREGDGSEDGGSSVEAEVEPMTAFEADTWRSLQFAGDKKRARQDISIDKDGKRHTLREFLVPAWKTVPVQEVAESGFGTFEAHTKGFGRKYLDKYDFDGHRIGAVGREGIHNPIKGQAVLGRSGLGTQGGRDHDPWEVAGDPRKVEVKEVGQNPKRARVGRERGRPGHSITEKGVYSTGMQRNDERSTAAAPAPLLQEDVDEARLQKNRPSNVPCITVLDDEDDQETEDEDGDGEFDNGRRAIAVDFDALVHGSAFARREAAYRKALADLECIAGKKNQNVASLLDCDGRDLGDEEAVRCILKAYGVDVTDEACDDLLARVDAAYDSAGPLVVNGTMLAALKSVSHSMYIGILHRGTRRRMNRELSQANLSNAFNTRKVVLFHSDATPYTKSVKELLCHLGVVARQCLFVAHEQVEGRVPSFVMGGKIVGARTLTRKPTLVDSDDKTGLDFTKRLKERAPALRIRRVLSLSSDNGMWYAGRVEYGHTGDHRPEKKVLVRYLKWGNVEWVNVEEDTVRLVRRDYVKIAAAGFPGLLEPDCEAP